MRETADVAYATFFLSIWIISLLGNLWTIVAICRQPELRTSPPFVLIVSLVVAEFGFSSSILPVITWHLMTGRSLIAGNQLLCDIQGGLLSMFGTSVVFFLNLISLNRFLFVFRPQFYKRLFTLRRSYFISAFTWLMNTLSTSGQFTGWIGFEFDKSFLLCKMKPPSDTVDVTVTLLLVFCPTLVTVIVYALLLRAMQRLRSQLHVRGGTDLRLEAIRFIKFLFFSWLLIFALGTPLLVLALMDTNAGFLFAQFCVALSGLHSSFNWLLLMLGNSYLKHSMRDLLVCRPAERTDQADQRILNAIRLLTDDI
nr:G protein-coupled receptor [Proales similis]